MNNKLKKHSSSQLSLIITFVFFIANICNAQQLKRIISSPNDEYIEVEAEKFGTQRNNDNRNWYLMSTQKKTKIRKDLDENHANGSSGYGYLELLPDSLYEKDKKKEGKNFCNKPCDLATLSYKVNFKTTGKYYIWIRGYSTGGHDNSIHVGIDGNWPESGHKLYLCEGKWNKWAWTSDQFTGSEGCNSKKRIYLMVNEPGVHEINFTMREVGFEFDKFVMTKSETKVPR